MPVAKALSRSVCSAVHQPVDADSTAVHAANSIVTSRSTDTLIVLMLIAGVALLVMTIALEIIRGANLVRLGHGWSGVWPGMFSMRTYLRI